MNDKKKKSGLKVNRLKGEVSFTFSYRKEKKSDDLLRSNMPLKLHLGCGNIRLENYINIDIVKTLAADLVADIVDLSMFPNESADEILMNAVFEHLYTFQHNKALKEWFRILKPNGRLIINWIPDFDIVANAYMKHERGLISPIFDLEHVFRYTHGAYDAANSIPQMHKCIFTKDSVRDLLERNGFEIVKLENAFFQKEHIAVNINVVAVKPKR